ncbi:MAG: InlB B-repeat-containing protein [Lachnospiraceae bacterium]|nr:InlB B-repeat-containing protein [Lachnospiraceae bacterium]
MADGRKKRKKRIDKRKRQKAIQVVKICGLLLGLSLAVRASIGGVYAEDAGGENNTGNLQNGSFEKGQTWDGNYKSPDQGNVPAWNTTATDGKIELFRSNTQYITGVTLKPSDGTYAAELNAEQESTLYQNVSTKPSSIYKWGLDHGARNATDTMALVIGPKQSVNPSKPNASGRDQLMQMVDWLIAQEKTSIKDSAHTGRGEQLVVYSKKFGSAGTFADNAGNNAFSLTPSSVYTEEWHIWIIADNSSTTGENYWGHYGANDPAENSGTEVDLNKYYYYTVPSGQTETLFGFVSVGCRNSNGTVDTRKSFGNFLDNINFQIYHPLSGSTTLHGSAVVAESDGTVGGEGGTGYGTGHEITVDQKLVTYVTDGDTLEVKAVIKAADAAAGCEFVGLYYTTQDTNGDPEAVFLKKDEWTRTAEGDVIYSYRLTNMNTAADLHFVFIKSPTVTYDSNGGKPYTVSRIYNTSEKENVYSFKPHVDEVKGTYTFIAPYVSQAAEGPSGAPAGSWRFMGWLLTGDEAVIPADTPQTNADQLGTMLLPAVHTIACDYTVRESEGTGATDQYFKIWEGTPSLTSTAVPNSSVKWTVTGTETESYGNIQKGLTMVAQWRWRQAFVPQLNSGSDVINSQDGGTIAITSVSGETNPNYEPNYSYTDARGSVIGKAYFAETNEIVTATATAKPGFTFLGWYDEAGHQVTAQATLGYIETKESVNTYYARFAGNVTQTYVRQLKNDTTGVWEELANDNIANDNIAILDHYSYSDVVGTTASATATAKYGYKFEGWYDTSGNAVAESMLSSDKKTISYTTTGNATYYARFTRIRVTQTYRCQLKTENTWTIISNNDIGTLSPYSYSCYLGQTASSEVTAVGEDYQFEGWYDSSGNKVSSSMLSNNGKTLRYATTGNATYYARFSGKMTQTYVRQLQNEDGVGWTNLTDTGDETVAALSRYSCSDFLRKPAGATAEAKYGYEFLGWFDEDGNPVDPSLLSNEGKTLSYTITGEATYYARFARIEVTQTYIRQLQDEDGVGWTDLTDTTDITVATLDQYSYICYLGETASATAEAQYGYKFEGWYDTSGHAVDASLLSSDKKTISYITTGNATYYARFSRIKVTQTYIRQLKTVDGWTNLTDTTDETVATLDPYTYTCYLGEAAGATAEAQYGYKFEGWYDTSGNAVAESMLSSDKKTISYTTTGNATYYARFSRIVVNQNYIRQIKNGETWEDTTDYHIATLDHYAYNCYLGVALINTATAKIGYKFEGWYDAEGNPVASGMLTNNGTTLSYTATGNATYYARFSRIQVNQTYIRQLKDGDGWTDITDDEVAILNRYTYTCYMGETASATAEAKSGYKFEGWYDTSGHAVAESMLSSDKKTITYPTTENATYYARFSRNVIQSYTENLTQEDGTLELSLDDLPEDVEEQDIIWNTSNPDIVTVDEDGNVVVVGNGTCTITAKTADGCFTFVWTITVNIPSSENSEENNTETGTEANTETDTEANTETDTEIDTETDTETNTETDTETDTESETENNTETTSEPDTETNTEHNQINNAENTVDKTDTNVNDANASYSPKTGDRSHLALWITLLLLSLTALIGVVVRRKNNR